LSLESDLERILLQEHALRFKRFDADAAWRIGMRLREMAATRSLPVAVDVRRFGHALFYAALPGATPDNAEWVRRKSNVVGRFHRSSYAIGLTLLQKNTDLMEKYGIGPADHASHGGSFPIIVESAGIIGSITVSGLPQREDHELVVEALCGELGREYAEFALPETGGKAA
jgi:uncharacterized protein (UPF0303 family)